MIPARTPDSWWQVSETDSLFDLELSVRLRNALVDGPHGGIDRLADLDLDALAMQRRVGEKTMAEAALLRRVLRYRFRGASPDRAAFEAALPGRRVRASWREARKEEGLESLELSPHAHRALESAGAATVGNVLDYSVAELRFHGGNGPKTREELKDLYAELRCRFSPDPASEEPRVDDYFEEIYPRPLPRRRRRGCPRDVVLRLLGLHPADLDLSTAWPTAPEIAASLGVTRSRVDRAVARARRRWRLVGRRPFRDDLLTILESHGGVLAPAALAGGLLARRGSAASPAVRERRAWAVMRAGVEAESLYSPRFRAYRRKRGVFVALTGEDHLGRRLAAYADELRRRAERLAGARSAEGRLLEVLRKVRPVAGVEPLGDESLLALAPNWKISWEPLEAASGVADLAVQCSREQVGSRLVSGGHTPPMDVSTRKLSL